MLIEDGARIAAALGGDLVATTTLAGGYSHETCLLELTNRTVVARFGGGGDPAIEAAVMTRSPVPVPEVLLVEKSAMAITLMPGAPLSEVLDTLPAEQAAPLGREVGRVVAAIGTVRLDRPGFFTDDSLAVGEQPPWSAQLAGFAETCMATTPPERLDQPTRDAWARLCAEHAPVLAAADDQARLAHGDINPKNILISEDGTRVEAVLDWEFAYSGCPYADAANMARFGAGYPDGFLAGFRDGFAEGADLVDGWEHIGRVFDMFALSDLVTRAPGHEVADQAAGIIRRWVAGGVPRTMLSAVRA